MLVSVGRAKTMDWGCAFKTGVIKKKKLAMRVNAACFQKFVCRTGIKFELDTGM